jgi:hypothetical protein
MNYQQVKIKKINIYIDNIFSSYQKRFPKMPIKKINLLKIIFKFFVIIYNKYLYNIIEHLIKNIILKKKLIVIKEDFESEELNEITNELKNFFKMIEIETEQTKETITKYNEEIKRNKNDSEERLYKEKLEYENTNKTNLSFFETPILDGVKFIFFIRWELWLFLIILFKLITIRRLLIILLLLICRKLLKITKLILRKLIL